jgi:preprotein translocase subunit SecG
MLTFFVVLQVIVAIFMILVVLLQPGNRGGASAALGGAGGDTVFGGRGANTLLSKITFSAAAIFMISNFALSFLSMPPKSVLDTTGALKQSQPKLPVLPSPLDSTETNKGTAKESEKTP